MYNITTNNSKFNNLDENNSVSYLLNNLRNINYAYNYKECLKNKLTSKDILLKQKFNDLKNQALNNQKCIINKNIKNKTLIYI